MCQHCCRLKRTPCDPIPYACPLCPVRKVTEHFYGNSKKRDIEQQAFGCPTLDREPDEHTDLCKEISDFYGHVVEKKRNLNKGVSRHEKQAFQKTAAKMANIKALPNRQNQFDNKIPVLYREQIYGEDPFRVSGRGKKVQDKDLNNNVLQNKT